jgi:uncharacterized coiled-coil protein SlyX
MHDTAGIPDCVDHDRTTRDRILLLEAEYAFAEESFLELSRQATMFQTRLRKITASLHLLTSQRKQLFRQTDNEMSAGQVTNEVPLGE